MLEYNPSCKKRNGDTIVCISIRSFSKIYLLSFFSRLKMFLINSPDIQILRKYFQIFLLGAENIQSDSLVIFSYLLELVFSTASWCSEFDWLFVRCREKELRLGIHLSRFEIRFTDILCRKRRKERDDIT